ncbi:MAG: excinuclease ABC subunit UvrA [Planctomycetes bacterium]|nr:excinuclease ABC subunit UvrA [Planctomycetota bacterium]
MANGGGAIRIRGARTHNLHNVNVDLPLGKLSVLTGPSGSGKSSLAFDTLHAEGQRRFLETLGATSRALFEQLQRPDVDVIEYLPPTLCVSQHVSQSRPRSTLATVTEIHDHLRLLWARFGTPYCYQCGSAIQKHSPAEIVRATLRLDEGRKVYLLAPLVEDEPGEHRDAFQQIKQGGFLRARIDGVLGEIRAIPKLAAKQRHTIELVVDRLVIRSGIEDRLGESLATAIKHGAGRVIVTDIDDGDWHDHVYSTQFACPRCRIQYPELEPRLFHFNNPHGACPRCTGFGQIGEFDPKLIVPDPSWSMGRVLERLREQLPDDLELQLGVAGAESSKPQPPRSPGLRKASAPATSEELLESLRKLRDTLEAAEDTDGLEALRSLAGFVPCPECGGARLNRVARSVRFGGRGLHELTALSVYEAAAFFEAARTQATAPSGLERVQRRLVDEIWSRLRFLQEVGLSYVTLDRPAPTLSGGEAQRARLATHLGGGLLGVCYILDEPTIGLHPRDTERLIAALRGLQERGNTVIAVEHDESVMRKADYLVDMGPGAGRNGGRVLASGTVDEVVNDPASVTGPYLKHHRRLEDSPAGLADDAPSPLASLRACAGTPHAITIINACHHNLKNLTVRIPLGRLVCLTGVSGSGKSSLARDILCYAARRHLGLLAPTPGMHDRIEGLEKIDKVLEVDQRPLGRSPRSNAASYTGVFDEIRKVFAATRTAKVRGYKASRFSFNVKGGRCEECQGQGRKRFALQFLPDLFVPCSACQGRRFNRATLEVHYRGKSIADILGMPIEQARDFFENIPNIHRPLAALADVGLGYLALGQPSSTLSGGEAQRVKLAFEFAKPASGKALYLLDEPTTGLHFADVRNLIRVLRGIVDAGNTMLVIEHNLDLIAAADWIIDLGPDGGAAGGYLVAEGTPAEVAACSASSTGWFLRREN